AEEIGEALAREGCPVRDSLDSHHANPNCLISCGEATGRLAPLAMRGKGGRNQQLVLAAAQVFAAENSRNVDRQPAQGITVLSGGTDGEDGPTDAAGAWVDAEVLAAALAKQLDVADFL